MSCSDELTIEAGATTFDQTTRLEPVRGEPGSFHVCLSEQWSSLVGLHGGYLTALAVRGASAAVPDRPVRTVSTSFLSNGEPGPATLSVQVVRQGRSLSTVTTELRQAGRLMTIGRVTLMAEQTGVEWVEPSPLLLPPPDACVAVDPPTHVRHFEQAEGRLDPVSVPFSDGPRARLAGYLRPIEGRAVDAAWLAMASDWFPPPAFVRLAPPAGGISIDLTTHIHRTLPPLGDGWLTAVFEVETSSGGLATEHGRIATADGVLVAEAFQTRWTAAAG